MHMYVYTYMYMYMHVYCMGDLPCLEQFTSKRCLTLCLELEQARVRWRCRQHTVWQAVCAAELLEVCMVCLYTTRVHMTCVGMARVHMVCVCMARVHKVCLCMLVGKA